MSCSLAKVSLSRAQAMHFNYSQYASTFSSTCAVSPQRYWMMAMLEMFYRVERQCYIGELDPGNLSADVSRHMPAKTWYGHIGGGAVVPRQTPQRYTYHAYPEDFYPYQRRI